MRERWSRGLSSELEREMVVGVRERVERMNESIVGIRLRLFDGAFILWSRVGVTKLLK